MQFSRQFSIILHRLDSAADVADWNDGPLRQVQPYEKDNPLWKFHVGTINGLGELKGGFTARNSPQEPRPKTQVLQPDLFVEAAFGMASPAKLSHIIQFFKDESLDLVPRCVAAE
jgi:hypothetical protein